MLSREGDVYRVTPARCRKVKEAGHPDASREKLATEAPVNGGRNYKHCSYRSLVVVKFGYMLETPPVSSATRSVSEQ